MATLSLPRVMPALGEPPLMQPSKLTRNEIAKMIADSVTASLRQAIQHGCTQEQVPIIAGAIGGNAGMVIWMEVLERGVADE